uniref:Peptidase C1A papain C-terminal domain-containing protein n=1 Tax=Meloidogyne javanica TaxID=6303 RepID=A0A915M2W6_MELJA
MFDTYLLYFLMTQKVKHFLQLKTDINGEWDFDMTVEFFLPIEFQLKLGGGNRWLAEGEDPNGKFEEGEIGAGPPIAEPRIESEVLKEAPSSSVDNEKDHQHPRDKRASCTFKNVFSARVNWPGCAPIINRITDQGQCGSCWAVATSTVFTDRLCIQRAKNGWTTPNTASYIYSALDTLGCSGGGDCSGGRPATVWQWMYKFGVVTGTSYQDYKGCKPYPFSHSGPTYSPNCVEKCYWNIPYFADKRKVKSWRYYSGNSINNEDTMREIRDNGPVCAIFRIFSDFHGYTGERVYRRNQYANPQENHVVAIIGYGTQVCNGYETDYWLVRNSWGTNWGDNGFFKIRRGWNECGIEGNQISHGIPII